MPQAAPTTDVAVRKIYVGNIPRTVTNDELRAMFAEHGTVVQAEAAKYGDAEMGQNIFSFVVNVVESAIKVWHDTGKVDARVNFLLDDQKTDTEKYAPVVNIDKNLLINTYMPSPLRPLSHPTLTAVATHFCGNILRVLFRRLPVWWHLRASSPTHRSNSWSGKDKDQENGSLSRVMGSLYNLNFQFYGRYGLFLAQYFVPSSVEKGQTLCRSPEPLDISIHEVLPRIFKETA